MYKSDYLPSAARSDTNCSKPHALAAHTFRVRPPQPFFRSLFLSRSPPRLPRALRAALKWWVACVLSRDYTAQLFSLTPLYLSVFSLLACAYKSIRIGFETFRAVVAGRTDAYSEPVPLLTEHDNKIGYFHGVFCTNIQWYRNIATEFTARKM